MPSISEMPINGMQICNVTFMVIWKSVHTFVYTNFANQNIMDMEDISNKELHEKMREGFNKILFETKQIHDKQDWIIDHLKPTYTNSRDIYQMVAELTEEVNKLNAKLAAIQRRLEGF
jgi:hypothetical protein